MKTIDLNKTKKFLLVYYWDRFLEVGLLGQRVNIYIVLLDTVNSAFTVFTEVEPVCIPTANIQACPFPPLTHQQNMLSNIWILTN